MIKIAKDDMLHSAFHDYIVHDLMSYIRISDDRRRRTMNFTILCGCVFFMVFTISLMMFGWMPVVVLSEAIYKLSSDNKAGFL